MTSKLFSLPQGFRFLPGYFGRAEQGALIDAVVAGLAIAPLYRPTMPRTGKPVSVKMSNFGPLGWVTDKQKGYRYEVAHPVNGNAWPEMPQTLLNLWGEIADYPARPEACLINYYAPGNRLGLHIDWDEEATDAAVVSVSLGDKARFRMGGPNRSDKSASMTLSSGDVVVLGGAARQCFHGVDRIYPGTSTLLPADHFPEGGRINLTLRRVTRPA
jgi:DNA oxidative demethylase